MTRYAMSVESVPRNKPQLVSGWKKYYTIVAWVNNDQHQFPPNNIHRLSSATSMRINKMITKRKISDLLSISPN